MALVRAAHQVYDQPKALVDPLAMRIIGPKWQRYVLDKSSRHLAPSRRNSRCAAVGRSRFAEDAMRAAVEGGVDQIVVLSAGLDTFPYRAALPAGVTIFEVDHPATQAWKRQKLSAAGISIPHNLTFVPGDLTKVSLEQALVHGGADLGRRLFVSWLGSAYYVPETSVQQTLRIVASFPQKSELVFDYLIEPTLLDDAARAEVRGGAESVAAIGEPWVTFLDPTQLATELAALGYSDVTTLSSATLSDRYGLSHHYSANNLTHVRVG
jgi:methyltransferase (TIGR00027 family)